MPTPGNKKIMDVNAQKVTWHTETLPRKTKKALDFLAYQKWMGNTNWYLAGGTALALQSGHRKSIDLDFFTESREFDNNSLLKKFPKDDWKANVNKKSTIYGELFGSKISFIAYPFFLPKQNFLKYGFVNVLDKTDVAVMKIVAVSQRGRKRDFFDLYWCANNIGPIEQIIRRLPTQYPSVAHDYHHILKSMVYFEDAESDPNPEIYFDADWKKVKKFFEKEVPAIALKLIK